MNTLICQVTSQGEIKLCTVAIPTENQRIKHPPRELNPAYKLLSPEVEKRVNNVKQLKQKNAELEKKLISEEKFKMRNYVPNIMNWFKCVEGEEISEKDYEELCINERWFIHTKGINH